MTRAPMNVRSMHDRVYEVRVAAGSLRSTGSTDLAIAGEAGETARAGKASSFSSRRSSFSIRSTTARGRVRRNSSGCAVASAVGAWTWSSGLSGWPAVVTLVPGETPTDTGATPAGEDVGDVAEVSQARQAAQARAGWPCRSDTEIRCRCGPRPRTTPSWIVVRAGMRSSRSVRS